MREVLRDEMYSIAGAGDPLADENSQLIRQIMRGAGWGAISGIRFGFPGMVGGALSSTAQTVIQGAMAKMPVNVPIPRVPLGPTWNGSK